VVQVAAAMVVLGTLHQQQVLQIWVVAVAAHQQQGQTAAQA
jgi:hypothetical protein